MFLHNSILFSACAMIGLAIGGRSASADIYTYSLSGQTGTNAGGAIGGTITLTGNPGDAFPALNDPSISAFSLTYTPTSGPVLTWTQAATIAVNYNAGADFIGKLGDATIFALPPASGPNFWSVTNPDSTELDIFFTPSPLGPNWLVKNPSLVDYNYGGISLTLQSDVTPEPGLAALGALLPVGLLRRRR